MFYRPHACLRQLRGELSGPDRHTRAEAEAKPPRPQAMSRLPTAPTAPQTTKVRGTPAKVARVRGLRQRVSGKNGHRWQNALALPSALLPRVLAVRRPQHLEGAARPQVHRGRGQGASRATTGTVPPLTPKEAPQAQGRSRRSVRRAMRRLRLLDLPRGVAVPSSRSLDERLRPGEFQWKSRGVRRGGGQMRPCMRKLPPDPTRTRDFSVAPQDGRAAS